MSSDEVCWYYRIEGHKPERERDLLMDSLRETGLLFGGKHRFSGEPAVRAFENLPPNSNSKSVLKFGTTVKPTSIHASIASWNVGTLGVEKHSDVRNLIAELTSNHPLLDFNFLRNTSFKFGVATIPIQIDTREKQIPIQFPDRRKLERGTA